MKLERYLAYKIYEACKDKEDNIGELVQCVLEGLLHVKEQYGDEVLRKVGDELMELWTPRGS